MSIDDLLFCANLTGVEPLSAVIQVFARLERFGLIVEPGVQIGDFKTTRLISFPQPRVVEELRMRAEALCEAGESQRIEFKSSLCADLKRFSATGELHQREELEGECLKTVCAFLNSDGGELLIGIADDGAYSGGLQLDLVVRGFNQDQWALHWVERLKTRFYGGFSVLPYVRGEIFDYGEGPVCLVTVRARTAPAFVKTKAGGLWEFYARFGPRSESLSIPDFYQYVEARTT